MKNIIQRNLDLKVKYKLLGVSYISIEDGGCICDNCGRLISNIASIKSIKGSYNIGTDCLESIIINNELLESGDYLQYLYSDKPAIAKAKSLRAKIIKQKKLNPNYTATLVTFDSRPLGDKFGFSFEIKDGDCFNGELYDKPMGWDYNFMVEYKELTLKYISGLYKEKELLN